MPPRGRAGSAVCGAGHRFALRCRPRGWPGWLRQALRGSQRSHRSRSMGADLSVTSTRALAVGSPDASFGWGRPARCPDRIRRRHWITVTFRPRRADSGTGTSRCQVADRGGCPRPRERGQPPGGEWAGGRPGFVRCTDGPRLPSRRRPSPPATLPRLTPLGSNTLLGGSELAQIRNSRQHARVLARDRKRALVRDHEASAR